ncbi:phytase [Microbulbifer yueqingensis]|uniref:3-phytase n=1 Tax=Microbulbifer yueqingensis TaxID=658219 RepID=A0A1G8Y395_9GAMM|nr:phytase [Microbulbifer yueqingensis]SDJ97308.1 3-phytase [Microbulbifer yueqingensis]
MALKVLWKIASAVTLLVLLSGCDPRQRERADPEPESLQASGTVMLSKVISSQLAPLQLQGKDYLLLASELRGLVLLNENGSEAVSLDGGSVKHFALQGQPDGSWLIAAYDEEDGEIHLRHLETEAATGQPGLKYLGMLKVPTPQSALCFSRQGERSHLFTIDESGLGHEYIVHPRDQAWLFTDVRPLYFGEQVNSCVVDDKRGRLLVSQPPLGIWSLNADAEREEDRRVFLNGQALAGNFGGLWLDPEGDVLWLTSGATVQVFPLPEPGARPLYARSLQELEPASIARLRDALFALEEESDIVQRYAVTLPEQEAGDRPAAAETASVRAPIPRVRAQAQTVPVSSAGDAAGDPAVWVNPRDKSKSLVLGTDRKKGLNIYSLSGRLLEQFVVGGVGNVDLRSLDEGRYAALAATANRTTPGVNLFGIRSSGNVEHLGLREMNLPGPNGLCMYRNDGRTFVWVSDQAGALHLAEIALGSDPLEWELQPRAKLAVRSRVDSCVVDDERGLLFFGEGGRGVWRLDIAGHLAGSAQPELVAGVDGEHLVADVEGIGLYRRGDHGYLVVSSQGNDTYALYSRDGNQFVGRFRVGANLARGIDGSSQTDGLEVTSAALGEAYPEGLLVVQDGRKRMPTGPQNFKLVSWADIAEQLQLD